MTKILDFEKVKSVEPKYVLSHLPRGFHVFLADRVETAQALP